MKTEEKKAKETFSRYVRLRDCIKTTRSTEYGKCYTCGKVVPFEFSQCGHFVSGRGNSLFFEENNSRLQCSECNCQLGGNHDKFRRHLIAEVGMKEVEHLESLRHVPKRISESEFKVKFVYFKKLINGIIEDN